MKTPGRKPGGLPFAWRPSLGSPAEVAVDLAARPINRPVRVRLHEQPGHLAPSVLVVEGL